MPALHKSPAGRSQTRRHTVGVSLTVAAALGLAAAGCTSSASAPSPVGSSLPPEATATPQQPGELLKTSGVVHDGDTASWGREWTGGRYSLVIACTSPAPQRGSLHWHPARSSGTRSSGVVEFSCSPQPSRTRQIVQLGTYTAVLQGDFTLEHDARIELSWATA